MNGITVNSRENIQRQTNALEIAQEIPSYENNEIGQNSRIRDAALSLLNRFEDVLDRYPSLYFQQDSSIYVDGNIYLPATCPSYKNLFTRLRGIIK